MAPTTTWKHYICTQRVHDSCCLVPHSDHIGPIGGQGWNTGMCEDEKAGLETEVARAQLFTTLSKDHLWDLCPPESLPDK